jgi:hypothetical protein
MTALAESRCCSTCCGSNLSRGRAARPRRTAPSRSAFSYTHCLETPKRRASSAADTSRCALGAAEWCVISCVTRRGDCLDGEVIEQRLAAEAAFARGAGRVHTPQPAESASWPTKLRWRDLYAIWATTSGGWIWRRWSRRPLIAVTDRAPTRPGRNVPRWRGPSRAVASRRRCPVNRRRDYASRNCGRRGVQPSPRTVPRPSGGVGAARVRILIPHEQRRGARQKQQRLVQSALHQGSSVTRRLHHIATGLVRRPVHE